jgi:hypothetical protein
LPLEPYLLTSYEGQKEFCSKRDCIAVILTSRLIKFDCGKMKNKNKNIKKTKFLSFLSTFFNTLYDGCFFSLIESLATKLKAFCSSSFMCPTKIKSLDRATIEITIIARYKKQQASPTQPAHYRNLCPNGDTWKGKSQPQQQGEG